MLPYILLIFLPMLYMCILLGLRSAYGLKFIPYKKTVIKFFFLILFVILSLRASTVGVDTPNYIRKLLLSGNLSWSQAVIQSESEIAFSLFTKLVSLFTKNPQIYLGIISAIILLPIARFYSEESEDPILTMLMFLILPMFGMLFSGLRQSIAIMLVVPTFYQVKKRNILKFIFWVVVAILFHRSAFIMLLLYPVYYMRLTRKKLVWIVPLIIVVYIFSESIFAVLLQLISYVYMDNDWEIGSTSAWAMLVLFILLLIFSYLFVDENKADEDMIGMRNILVLSVILQCFSSVNILAMRMNYYFLLFFPLLIPKVIWKASGKNALTCRIADVVLCLYFLYYFLDLGFKENSGFGIFPYIPFWKS